MYATTGIVSTPKICGVKEKQTDRVRVVGIDKAILRGAYVCKYKFGMARPISAAADNIYVPICSFLLHGGKERREGREREKTSKTHGGRHSVATALSEEKICDNARMLREFRKGEGKPQVKIIFYRCKMGGGGRFSNSARNGPSLRLNVGHHKGTLRSILQRADESGDVAATATAQAGEELIGHRGATVSSKTSS